VRQEFPDLTRKFPFTNHLIFRVFPTQQPFFMYSQPANKLEIIFHVEKNTRLQGEHKYDGHSSTSTKKLCLGEVHVPNARLSIRYAVAAFQAIDEVVNTLLHLCSKRF